MSNNPKESDEEIKVTDPLSSVVLLADEIQKDIETKLEPIQKLRQINQLLNDYHDVIHGAITKEASGGIKKKDFYSKVFKVVSDRMLNEKVL